MRYYASERKFGRIDHLLINGYTRRSSEYLIPKVVNELCLQYFAIFEEWDDEWKSESIQIENDSLNHRCICTDNSHYFHTILGTKRVRYGKHHWRLKLKEYRSNWGYWRNVCGIVKTSEFTKDMLTSNQCVNYQHGYFYIGFVMYKALSAITSDQSSHKLTPYGRSMVMFGDIIDIYLDLEYGTLSFALNGEYFGISHRIDIDTEYRICVVLNGKNTSFEILSYTHQSVT